MSNTYSKVALHVLRKWKFIRKFEYTVRAHKMHASLDQLVGLLVFKSGLREPLRPSDAASFVCFWWLTTIFIMGAIHLASNDTQFCIRLHSTFPTIWRPEFLSSLTKKTMKWIMHIAIIEKFVKMSHKSHKYFFMDQVSPSLNELGIRLLQEGLRWMRLQ